MPMGCCWAAGRLGDAEVHVDSEALTPPTHEVREALTPPLPARRGDSDDDLDLILGDIDGILSDDEDSGRPEPQKSKPQIDLRTKLPPKSTTEQKKQQRQKIQADKEKDEDKKSGFPNRRVILQRKSPKEKSVFSRIEVKAEVAQGAAGIFSRALRTATAGGARPACAPCDLLVDSASDDEAAPPSAASTARVANLPPGITDTRLRTLAGNHLQ
ncbi:hypothetical protein HF086_016929, partial [Spodoptera exigua]